MAREPIFNEIAPARLTLFWANAGAVMEQTIQVCLFMNII